MKNLLQETIVAIEECGERIENILFLGVPRDQQSCTWSEFQTLANVEYDESWGRTYVKTGLVIIFKDGRELRRDEYDGREWWTLYEPTPIPIETTPLESVFDDV